MSTTILKIIQISDMHISTHKNLLEPMIDQINKEDVDLVVFTGDTVHERTNELFEKANSSISKIKHNVIAIPGDYDGGDLWKKTFGSNYRGLSVGDYDLEFLDTSFLGHRFYNGWGATLKDKDVEQYDWLVDRINNDKYHILFAHHPFIINEEEKSSLGKSELLKNNIRAIYYGHLRDTHKFYFKYEKSIDSFDYGFGTNALKFHGNSCYLLIHVDSDNKVSNIPRLLNIKKTAWN